MNLTCKTNTDEYKEQKETKKIQACNAYLDFWFLSSQGQTQIYVINWGYNFSLYKDSDSNHSTQLTGDVLAALFLFLSFINLPPFTACTFLPQFITCFLQCETILTCFDYKVWWNIVFHSFSHHSFCHPLPVPSLCSDVWVLS